MSLPKRDNKQRNKHKSKTMTNEEKAREIANNCSTKIVGAEVSDETYITTEPDCYTAAMAMAQWKDERIKELEVTLNCRSKYERIYRNEFLKAEKEALINKACEWLRENASKHIHGQYSFLKGLMLEEFQQAMKGGEQ